MKCSCPAGSLRPIRGEPCVVQPAPIKEFGVPVCHGSPCQAWDRFDHFAQLSLSALQPLILALQFQACRLRLPEIEAVGDPKCYYTTNQLQEADVLTGVDSSERSGHA